jgi:hypothetical protein
VNMGAVCTSGSACTLCKQTMRQQNAPPWSCVKRQPRTDLDLISCVSLHHLHKFSPTSLRCIVPAPGLQVPADAQPPACSSGLRTCLSVNRCCVPVQLASLTCTLLYRRFVPVQSQCA